MTLAKYRLVLAAVGLLALGEAAQAHAHLLSAVPPVGAVVTTPPTELALTFSEGLSLRFSGVHLVGSRGKAVPTGAGALAAGGDTVLVVPLADPLAAGVYTVDWHALSTDGHKTSGRYNFTIGR